MAGLQFDTRFKYRHSESGTRGTVPVLPVTISGPSGYDTELLLPVDSGAELTVLRGDLCDALGLDLLSGERSSISFANGQGMDVYQHQVDVAVQSEDGESFNLERDLNQSFTMKVSFAHGELQREVLGRDFLEHFLVAFDEREQWIYLGAPGQSPSSA